jgi:hypothetical protein
MERHSTKFEIEKASLANIFELCTDLADFRLLEARLRARPPSKDGKGAGANLKQQRKT